MPTYFIESQCIGTSAFSDNVGTVSDFLGELMTAHDKNDKEWNINKDEVVRELTEANLRVDDPVVEELVRQYPEYEHQIRQIIMDTQAVDLLLASLERKDENNFEVTSSDITNIRPALEATADSISRKHRLVPWLLLCLIMVIIIAVSLVLFKN